MRRHPHLIARPQIADDKADLPKVGFVFSGRAMLIELKVVRQRGC
jgi:hypothetical protein